MKILFIAFLIIFWFIIFPLLMYYLPESHCNETPAPAPDEPEPPTPE